MLEKYLKYKHKYVEAGRHDGEEDLLTIIRTFKPYNTHAHTASRFPGSTDIARKVQTIYNSYLPELILQDGFDAEAIIETSRAVLDFCESVFITRSINAVAIDARKHKLETAPEEHLRVKFPQVFDTQLGEAELDCFTKLLTKRVPSGQFNNLELLQNVGKRVLSIVAACRLSYPRFYFARNLGVTGPYDPRKHWTFDSTTAPTTTVTVVFPGVVDLYPSFALPF